MKMPKLAAFEKFRGHPSRSSCNLENEVKIKSSKINFKQALHSPVLNVRVNVIADTN
jgi:hypothetical protein